MVVVEDVDQTKCVLTPENLGQLLILKTVYFLVSSVTDVPNPAGK